MNQTLAHTAYVWIVTVFFQTIEFKKKSYNSALKIIIIIIIIKRVCP